MGYQNLKLTKGIFLGLIIDHKKAEETFLFDFFAFIIGIGATVLVNLEYYESVNRLFKKERMLN